MRRFGLLLLLPLIACKEEAAPRGSYVYTPEVAVTPRALDPDVPILYLNKCEGGCTLFPGPDDSRTNRSSILDFAVTLGEFPHEDIVWKRMRKCVQEMYEPFEIQITDVDPGDTPHIESIVAGHPWELGITGAAGVSPFGCGVIENAINYTFPEVAGDNPINLCYIVAQESGHSFGLDHLMLCDDPMTYLPACGEKEFRRVDAFCGEYSERECFCGGEFQNSHLWLLDVLGERVTPVNYIPIIEIVVPEDEDEVEPSFAVFAQVDDDDVALVQFFIDGQLTHTTSSAPYNFRAPEDIDQGLHEISARVFDEAGQEDEHSITVEVGPRRHLPDAGGMFDAGQDPGPPPRIEPDAPPEPEPYTERSDVTTIDDDGCTCVQAHRSPQSWFLLTGLLLLWRRRR